MVISPDDSISQVLQDPALGILNNVDFQQGVQSMMFIMSSWLKMSGQDSLSYVSILDPSTSQPLQSGRFHVFSTPIVPCEGTDTSWGTYMEGGSSREVDGWGPTLGGRQALYQTSSTRPSKELAGRVKKSRLVFAGRQGQSSEEASVQTYFRWSRADRGVGIHAGLSFTQRAEGVSLIEEMSWNLCSTGPSMNL